MRRKSSKVHFAARNTVREYMFAYPTTYEDIEELVDRANALAEDHERLQKLLNLDEPGTSAPAGPVRRNQTTKVNGVKFKFGTKPKWWINAKTGNPDTNVTYVRWHRAAKKWHVKRIDHTGKLVYIGCFATLAEAVEARRGIKDGVMGPGELVVDEADGTVHVTKCSKCCRSFPLGHFAPVPCLINLQKLPRFEAATAAFASADARERNAAWEALSVIPTGKKGCTALRTALCFTCRETVHKSDTEGNSHQAACYRMAQEIRTDMAKRGCSHPDCTECRPECFEGDHKDRDGKICAQYRCTNWKWFASQYGENGPAEMWKCYEGTQVLCKNDHIMEDSHNAARGVDSTTLVGQAKQWRKNHEDCVAYNNARKIGKECKYCKLSFTKANARMGAWTHPADGAGKTTSVGNLVKAGASLATQRPRIDHVIDVECNNAIACHNCHYAEETYPMYKRQEERLRELVDTVHVWGGGDERTRGVKRPREDECLESE